MGFDLQRKSPWIANYDERFLRDVPETNSRSVIIQELVCFDPQQHTTAGPHTKHNIIIEPTIFLVMSKKRKGSVGDAISTLNEVLSEREKDLDTREEKLRQDQERFDVTSSAYDGEAIPSDILRLNIGGTTTMVLRSTLTSVPGSMLASMFSGRWDKSIQKDKDGNFFLDHDYFLFDLMLRHLRNMAIGDSIYPIFPSKEAGRGDVDFHRMVEYYGMTESIYPIKLFALRGTEHRVEMDGAKKANAKTFTEFFLASGGHTRDIRTYEVKLGAVKKVIMYWDICRTMNPYVGDVSKIKCELRRHENSSCVHLKWCFSCHGENIKYMHLADISHCGDSPQDLEGIVVRSGDYGRFWYVNGELIEPPIDFKEKMALFPDQVPLFPPLNPSIGLQGDFEVTKVELDF